MPITEGPVTAGAAAGRPAAPPARTVRRPDCSALRGAGPETGRRGARPDPAG